MKSILLVLSLALLTSPAAATPPNLVIFLADDQGWGDLSANGNTQVRTPHIDSLARDGARMERFLVCPVCAPTRAEFFTGRYHPRTGVTGVSTGEERLNLDEKTIFDAFRAAGYATGAFGKWHNGSQWPYHPNARGIDEYVGFTSGHWGEYFDPPLEHNGQPIRGKGYIADDLTGRAVDFIRRHREKPFLCYVPFNIPHSPWAVPDEDWQRFKDKPLTQRATQPAAENQDHTRCALAMTENLDRNVGRVLEELRASGLESNTIVVYFSDNGPNSARWNGGLKGRKGDLDDGGVRSPLFLRWPTAVKPGTVVGGLGGAIDLLPTLCALAGVPQVGGKPLDGIDLSPWFRGAEGAPPERTLFSTRGSQASARTPRWRRDAKGSLFDLDADPGQTRDLALQHSEVAERLSRETQAWAESVFPGGRPGKGGPVDVRPFPVGYREFPRTVLPARDGILKGGVKRSAPAPNCSYFVNWTALDDRLNWHVDVHTAGAYEVEILYTCPEADAGSRYELSLGEARLEGTVTPGWDPPLYTNQDTLPRPPAESRMKEFRALRPGVIRLPAGPGTLSLRALEIPGREVMQVRSISLTLRN